MICITYTDNTSDGMCEGVCGMCVGVCGIMVSGGTPKHIPHVCSFLLHLYRGIYKGYGHNHIKLAAALGSGGLRGDGEGGKYEIGKFDR